MANDGMHDEKRGPLVLLWASADLPHACNPCRLWPPTACPTPSVPTRQLAWRCSRRAAPGPRPRQTPGADTHALPAGPGSTRSAPAQAAPPWRPCLLPPPSLPPARGREQRVRALRGVQRRAPRPELDGSSQQRFQRRRRTVDVQPVCDEEHHPPHQRLVLRGCVRWEGKW